MIPFLDPDPESETEFQIFCNSRYGFGSRKKWNHNRYRGVMIPALGPDPETEFPLVGNSGSGFGFCKKWNRITSRPHPSIRARQFGEMTSLAKRRRFVCGFNIVHKCQRLLLQTAGKSLAL